VRHPRSESSSFSSSVLRCCVSSRATAHDAVSETPAWLGREKHGLALIGAFLAEIAVACLRTRTRMLVMLAAVSPGGCGVMKGVVTGAVTGERVLKVGSSPELRIPR